MTGQARPEAPVRLSICIPTYNFGPFIGETLESILCQLAEGVEVVVLDGGSTDNTTEVVRSFQRRFPGLRYHRLDERGGIDRDMARTVDLASGEYCWIFCSDDLLKPNAIPRVLDHIRSQCDLYLCGMTLCTRDMRPFKDHPVLRTDSDAEFELGDERERHTYFELAQTTTAFFSFAGSLIVKKQRWDAVGLDEAFVGSLWAHVARLFSMIPTGLRVKYLAEPYLDKRTDNDSFMDRGIVHRYGIAIDGYHRLAHTFFGEASFEARQIRRVVANEFPPWILLNAKLESRKNGRPQDLPNLDRLAAKAYSDASVRNWAYHLVYRGTPVAAYEAGLRSYRALKSLVRKGSATANPSAR